ncbi:Conserved_hypothetical protein [Hexamita inflata]|uniref:Uncharacterized protein n=1 Tax=Hexamita inflata TaxID=28002 RepID=A0AA86NRQ5_9EUKA|nr:Conserved hypothetical protein [Hexamita inflata]
MSEPKINVYSTKTMVGNWVEERATREAVIKQYLEVKAKGDIKAAELQEDLNNLMKPVALSNSKVVRPSDKLLIILHSEQMPLSISTDVRFPHFDFRSGYVCSLSTEISAARRHVFQLVRVQEFGASKMGKRTQQINSEQPLKMGDKFYLQADSDMVAKALKREVTEPWVLGCPRVVSAPTSPIVIAPLSMLEKEAEFMVEDYQAGFRLQGLGQEVSYDYPLVLRHVASGQCIGCGNNLTRFAIDLPTNEYKIEARSILDDHKLEKQNNCITFKCDNE